MGRRDPVEPFNPEAAPRSVWGDFGYVVPPPAVKNSLKRIALAALTLLIAVFICALLISWFVGALGAAPSFVSGWQR